MGKVFAMTKSKRNQNAFIPVMFIFYFFIIFKSNFQYDSTDDTKNVATFLLMLALPFGLLYLLNKVWDVVTFLATKVKHTRKSN